MGYAGIDSGNRLIYSDLNEDNAWTSGQIRLATSEESAVLLDRLKKDGKKWNSEKNCLESYRWIPEIEEQYFVPDIMDRYTSYDFYFWSDDEFDNFMLSKNLVFKTQEDAEALAEKIFNFIKE